MHMTDALVLSVRATRQRRPNPSESFTIPIVLRVPKERRFRNGLLYHGLALLLASVLPALAAAQTPPEQNGLRFNRLGQKAPATLAMKPGGPTERIEIQSTDDHIDYVVKTYVLKNANASEVFETIQHAVDREGGRVYRISQGSTVSTDEETLECRKEYSGDSMLVVTVPDWMIPYLDQTIAALDRKGLEASALGTGAIFAKIKHRLPSEVAELIRETAAGPSVVLTADDARQILYIEDTPSFFPCDLEALRAFDVPPPEIDTRVRIFEIDENRGRDVGLDWHAWKKSISDGALTLDWEGKSGSYNPDLQSLAAELSFTPQLATEFLNYLVSQGRAKVITDTRLRQTNNRQATIRSTIDLPYVIRGFNGESVADAPLRDSPCATDAEGTIKEFTEGVVVKMTPRIGAEIEMAVKATVSSHVGYTPNQNVPLIAGSSVDTVVLLAPGKPTVLGGLSRESRVKANTGVAGLGALPGLKRLFSREIERRQKSQIVITIELDRVAVGESRVAQGAGSVPDKEP